MRGDSKIIHAAASEMVQTTARFDISEILHGFQLQAAIDTQCGAATSFGANLLGCLPLWSFA